MPSKQDIEDAQTLLAAHRATLANFLNQQATFSIAHTPPAVLTGMREARTEIQSLKGVLRAWNVPVEDLPNDPALPPAQAVPPPPAVPARPRRLWQDALAAAAKGEWAHAERLFAQVEALNPQYEDVQTRRAEAHERATLAAARADDDWEAVLAALANAPPDFADPQGHQTWAEARQRRDQRYEVALKAAATPQWQAAVPYLVALLSEAPGDQEIIAWLAHVPPLQAEVARRQRWLPAMVEVPAGPLLMGSSAQQIAAVISERANPNESAKPTWVEDEQPQHTLTLPRYAIGKTPVTNAQFRPFVEGDGYTNQAYWDADGWQRRKQAKRVKPSLWDDAKWHGANYPVVGVTWYEAMAYTRWLSAQTGLPFSLPTEAMWEKAARGPDGRIYPWGNNWEQGRCNSREANIERTTPVGQYPGGASPYGALDMAGNVWEWCSTPLLSYPLANELLNELRTSSRYVLRGGSWGDDRVYARCALRFDYYPHIDGGSGGFRIAHLFS